MVQKPNTQSPQVTHPAIHSRILESRMSEQNAYDGSFPSPSMRSSVILPLTQQPMVPHDFASPAQTTLKLQPHITPKPPSVSRQGPAGFSRSLFSSQAQQAPNGRATPNISLDLSNASQVSSLSYGSVCSIYSPDTHGPNVVSPLSL